MTAKKFFTILKNQNHLEELNPGLPSDRPTLYHQTKDSMIHGVPVSQAYLLYLGSNRVKRCMVILLRYLFVRSKFGALFFPCPIELYSKTPTSALFGIQNLENYLKKALFEVTFVQQAGPLQIQIPSFFLFLLLRRVHFAT